MINNTIERKIHEIDKSLEELPKGTLTYKTINGKKQPYLQSTVDGKSISYYIKRDERESIFIDLENRDRLIAEKKRLNEYLVRIQRIIKNNPYLGAPVGSGFQDFDAYVNGKQMYIDKTGFIREWWNKGDTVTLITRPRRFGKTLMLSTVEHFFSPRFKDRESDFHKLEVWKDINFRSLHGMIPVIFVSFAGAKGSSFIDIIRGMSDGVRNAYLEHSYLLDSNKLDAEERDEIKAILRRFSFAEDAYEFALNGINRLAEFIIKHYDIKPIILLDEYDAPIQEAYMTNGDCREQMFKYCRRFFSTTFKSSNRYTRVLITGTTKLSKNAMFSDMNYVDTNTVVMGGYADYFGFTEQEVMDLLECQDIHDMASVKEWYDGFTIAGKKDIYNPWSIVKYAQSEKFYGYWVNTSDNSIIGHLVRRFSYKLKNDMEDLLNGKSIRKRIDEEIALQYLDETEESFWSLLVATGYVKLSNIITGVDCIKADLSITNKETGAMFERQMSTLLGGIEANDRFIDAFIKKDLLELNDQLNEITHTVMSYYDTAKYRSPNKAPENFFHGLVLGLLVSLKKDYKLTSNRESGYGRYDITLIPYDREKDAFIIEFKVRDIKLEKSLEETAAVAINQIQEKCYDTDIIAEGFSTSQIIKMAFAFEGKDALVTIA